MAAALRAHLVHIPLLTAEFLTLREAVSKAPGPPACGLSGVLLRGHQHSQAQGQMDTVQVTGHK